MISQENKKQRKANESSAAGSASQGSQLGPGSFYVAAYDYGQRWITANGSDRRHAEGFGFLCFNIRTGGCIINVGDFERFL